MPGGSRPSARAALASAAGMRGRDILTASARVRGLSSGMAGGRQFGVWAEVQPWMALGLGLGLGLGSRKSIWARPLATDASITAAEKLGDAHSTALILAPLTSPLPVESCSRVRHWAAPPCCSEGTDTVWPCRRRVRVGFRVVMMVGRPRWASRVSSEGWDRL